jgi:hypothetical protein
MARQGTPACSSIRPRHPEVLIMQQRPWTRTIPVHHPFHLMSGFTVAQAKGADR